ncbi:import inner membrane translocase, subunit Tim44 [Hydrogenovibrio crunogenus]|uniref:Import inner membrane translocase, subunit Tim44 n=1 Tax=Hydrogenovibrio crunogenus TaxID=39765 RepID=A0A4P7NWW5_9GAMM|nr:TIM44-like domain-containing protein [Hydrogenovibrio crunogenus]QBZ82201.1 import inner membrane translocase, subunit Tim44 [Hydrogenovibrio crunogenus]
MKKVTLWLSMITFTFFATMQVAEAKRFGGGGSFGYSKQIAPKKFNSTKPSSKTDAANAKSNTTAAGTRPSGASRFLGPLAGIAAGGLLAAMLFGDGFDGIQLLDIMLIALVAFLLFSFLKKRQAAMMQPAYSRAPSHSAYETESRQTVEQMRETHVPTYEPNASGSIIGSALPEQADLTLEKPEWFDEASFIEASKEHFRAVQKAWDTLDARELTDYCTPELFAALQSEMDSLQAGENHTEVDELNAETVDMAVDGEYFIVSVRFSGFIKEERNDVAHAFNEIWHIRRLAVGEGNWQIAGIQQNQI